MTFQSQISAFAVQTFRKGILVFLPEGDHDNKMTFAVDLLRTRTGRNRSTVGANKKYLAAQLIGVDLDLWVQHPIITFAD